LFFIRKNVMFRGPFSVAFNGLLGNILLKWSDIKV